MANIQLSKNSIEWGGVYGHSGAIDFERDLTIVALTNTAVEGIFGRFSQDLRRANTDIGR